MRKYLIPQTEIRNRHPKGMVSYTDREYSNFASLLIEAIKETGIRDLGDELLTEIAINLTMYYEDVIADACIWRGFTDKVHEMYGKYLPFYDLDEEEYMRDEPNIEDIRFVIWNTLIMCRFPQGRIVNPETPAILIMAKVAYELMDKWFEKIPVNEELKDFFVKAKFLDNLYELRDVLKWISFHCYLTYMPNHVKKILDYANDYSLFFDNNHDVAYYAAESALPYEEKVGPLALYAQEWLGIILRANGLEKEALDVERQEQKPLDIYKIVKAERGKGVEFENANGEIFYVTDEKLGNPAAEHYESKTAFGAFVKYRDSWYLNAAIIWSPEGMELFEITKKDVERKARLRKFDYDKLMATSGGSPFFYFENYQKMADFLTNEGGLSRERLKEFKIEDKNDRFLLMVSSKEDFSILYGNKVECCLKDVRNPYYDENVAKRDSLVFAFKLPGNLLKYAMDSNMLPHAQLNSCYGSDRGKALFCENYDFFLRATMRDDYQ